MDPRHYLTHAGNLLQQVKSGQGLVSVGGSAECRSVISRAYYASFHVAAEILGVIGFSVTDSGQCHVIVQQGLNNSGETDLVTASSHLSTLSSERRKADYEMQNPRPENPDQAGFIVELAKETIDLLDNCSRSRLNDIAIRLIIESTILHWIKTQQKEKQIWRKQPKDS